MKTKSTCWVYLVYFFALLLLSSGCDWYTSKYPVGTVEDSYINKDLLGTWEFVWNSGDKLEEAHLLQVFPFNSKEYLIRMYSNDTMINPMEMELAKAYASRIGIHEMINLRSFQLEDPEGCFNTEDWEFLVFRAIRNEDTLHVYGFDEDEISFEKGMNDFSSMDSHRKFVEESLNDPELWKALEYKYVKKDLQSSRP